MIENNAIEINPSSAPQRSIIWLHGLGADGYDFVNVADELNLPNELAVRFVFPHAPIRSVTINNGYKMRAWFDLNSLDINAMPDIQGMKHSLEILQNLIEREINLGISTKNIFVAGFSQGATIALLYILCGKYQLGGAIALSGFLPSLNYFSSEIVKTNSNIRILMAHGTNDELIPLKWAEQSKNELEKLGFAIEWFTYHMAHSVCPSEIHQISQWLLNNFGYG